MADELELKLPNDIESGNIPNLLNPSSAYHAHTLKTVPAFHEAWEAEYKEATFQPHTIRAVCSIGSVFFLVDFVYSMFAESSDGTGGDLLWNFLTQFPHLLCSLIYCLLLMSLNLQSLRNFCIRNYNLICAFKIQITYVAVIVPRVILEFRRANFQRDTYRHIRWGINFTWGLPVRTCNDTNPVLTWTMNSCTNDYSSVGCENTILAGGMLSTYIFLNLMPLMYHMSPRGALCVCLVNCLMFTAASLLTGSHGTSLYLFVAFQIVAGSASAYFCNNQEIFSKKQFSIIKGTKFASEQNGNLLYTLIPRNVVARLATHKDGSLLCSCIEHCTVMFCSLEPHAQLRMLSPEVFELLNKVFSEFDQAVKRYGMYKYQHVNDWYIVACPRAANPFDEVEQAKPYPLQYTMSMIFLAQELCTIAKRHRVDQCQLWLKVGIHCGPVAGAVIGHHRSFYCLYGDTINTAARMCKVSDGKTFCTSSFHSVVQSIGSTLISWKSCGLKEIKGKGPLEIFKISVHDSYYKVARAFRGSQTFDGEFIVPGDRRTVLKRKSWVPTTLSSPFIERTMDNLSQESFQWLKDPARRISRRWVIFKDQAYETLFMNENSFETREELLAGLIVHVFTYACQYCLAVYPEYQYDFLALGSPQLAAASNHVLLALTIHWAVVSVYCLILMGVMVLRPQWSKYCQRHYVLIKLSHMIVGIATFIMLPQRWGLMLSFTFEMICLHGAMATLSYRLSLALICIALIGFAGALSIGKCVMPYTFVKALGYAVAAICLSRIANRNLRFRWRLNKLFEAELDRLREKLFDLLPARIAKSMIEETTRLPCETCTAAVLQLDICEFTAMSQQLSPIEVAKMVHHLFSDFDSAVQASGLFKMDTVGDAYLIAGFLPPLPDEDEDAANQLSVSSMRRIAEEERSRVCDQMLCVARSMIESVKRYRTESGRAVRCRIGLSVGSVLTGVLGVLQPRFHMYGPGMRSAEALEQTGVPGAVHASGSFAQTLWAGKRYRSLQVANMLRNTSRMSSPNPSSGSDRAAKAGCRCVSCCTEPGGGHREHPPVATVSDPEFVFAPAERSGIERHPSPPHLEIETSKRDEDDEEESVESNEDESLWRDLGWTKMLSHRERVCTCARTSSIASITPMLSQRSMLEIRGDLCFQPSMEEKCTALPTGGIQISLVASRSLMFTTLPDLFAPKITRRQSWDHPLRSDQPHVEEEGRVRRSSEGSRYEESCQECRSYCCNSVVIIPKGRPPHN